MSSLSRANVLMCYMLRVWYYILQNPVLTLYFTNFHACTVHTNCTLYGRYVLTNNYTYCTGDMGRSEGCR